MKLLLTDKALRFPPIACRLLARHQLNHNRVFAMSDAEIAVRSQLPMGQVKHIGWSLSWDEIPFGQMIRFLNGCEISFDDRDSVKRNTMMMNSGTFLYLRKSALWDSQFCEMVKYWRSHRGK